MTLAEDLRRRVARDAGIATSVADTWVGETQEIVVREALAHAERTRGAEGVKEVHRRFAEADLRESPDEIRARVARDLELPFALREKLSSATKTEAEIVDDGLALLKQSGGQAALDEGVRKLQGRAMDSLLREQHAGPQTIHIVDSDDPNAWLRAAAGRSPDAA